MRALDRKLVRDLWRIKGPALAIAMVIGCGVATVVMSFGMLHSLEETRNSFYERHRFADVFAHVERAPELLTAKIARIPGVARAESRIVVDVTLDIAGMAEPATGRLISVPERRRPALNDLYLRNGRYIAGGRGDEVMVGEAFAEAHGFVPGDHLFAIINGHKRRLRIVGVALSPEYVYAIGAGQILPDDKRYGVLWMGRQALEAAYDLDGAFNDVSLRLLRGASTDEVIARLDALLERYGGVGAYDRDEQISDAFLSSELDELDALGHVIPPIFLGVAAFLLNIVVSRLVDIEREQIGLLKAFGYGNRAVGWHYLKLVLVLVAVGVALGFLGGAWLGRGVTEIYTQYYRFPVLHYRASPDVFAAAGLVSLIAAAAGTLGAVRRAVRLPPAVAMAPAMPTMYSRTLVERSGLADAFAQPTRMILRHVSRWPARAALTTVGIAMSVAILVGSMFSLDAIDHMIETYFFQSQRQDVTVTFEEPRPARVLEDLKHLPGVLRAEVHRDVPTRLRFAHRSRLVAVKGLSAEADLSRLLDVRLRPVGAPPEGIVLTTKLASLLGAAAGDEVTVEVLEGRRPVVRARVAALVEEYIGTGAYMDVDALNRLMGEGPTASGARLLIDGRRQDDLYRELKNTPAVAGVLLQTAAVDAFRDTMGETLTTIIFFYVLFAGMIAVGVAYNSARVSLSERGRELASLRVLGFTRFEVSYILLGELALLTLLALPLGCLFGYGLAWATSLSLDSELFRVPLIVERSTYGFAVLVAALAAVLSGLIVRRRIDRLDLVAVLKTRE